VTDHLDETAVRLDDRAAQAQSEIGEDLAYLAAEEAAELGLAAPVELGELLSREMPPREWLIEGLLQERDLGMIHAYRGVGKSRVAHGVAVAVAGGGAFLRWHAREPRGVLLVDGELPREDLQTMLAQAVAASDCEPVAPLRVLSADLSDAPVLSLATEEGREQVERHLDGISLLILDSITTLCPGSGPENDAESWEAMQSWLLDLRRRGIAVMLVHHDGKAGSQRGTSKREDILSQVVQLRRPSDYRPSQGARIEVHFTKSRGIVGDAADPFEAWLESGPDGHLAWTWRPLEDAQAIRAQRLKDEGLTQREIAQEMGIGLGSVNRALKRSSVPPPNCGTVEQES
jgi:putative DNA primase/helicase